MVHTEDRADAEYSAAVNARDTMAERGAPNAREGSFAYRKAYVATLEMFADCPTDFDFRTA